MYQIPCAGYIYTTCISTACTKIPCAGSFSLLLLLFLLLLHNILISIHKVFAIIIMRLIISQKIDQLWYVAHGTVLINFYMEFTCSEFGAEYHPIPNLKSLSKFPRNREATVFISGSRHFRKTGVSKV